MVGGHVTQKGSYVGPDRLRFDFSNPQAVGKDELVAVERDAVLVQDDAAQPDAGAEPHAPAGAVGRLDVLVLA